MSGIVTVRADGLGLRAGHTSVWSELDFSFGPGLGAVSGISGSGRSTLLLALVGRMSGLTGTLTVDGLDAVGQARRVRAVTSVARIGALIDLEGRLTVAESVTERALIDRVPTAEVASRFDSLAARAGLSVDRDRLVDDLDALDATLLTACLALLRPAVVTVLDDADRDLTVAEQRLLYRSLTTLAGDATTIVVGTREPAALPPGTAEVQLPDPRTGPDTSAPTPTAPTSPVTPTGPTSEPRRSR